MVMMRIHWNDEFKLGLPAIDADHEELVELCNQFLEAAQNAAPITELAGALDRLLLRTRAHFLHEERMLDRHGYPGLAIHKAEHERLLSQAETLKARFEDVEHEEDVRQVTLETADFLQSWLLDHIKVNDRPYRPFLMSLA